MKRCPQCNRVETDEALMFCRVDGATLVSDSSAIDKEAGTVRLNSGSVSSEIARVNLNLKRTKFDQREIFSRLL